MISEKTYRYKNPWHDGTTNYGPAFYETKKAPKIYRGFQVFNRFEKSWEVVKDGVCLAQRAGRSGAEYVIDGILDGSDDYFVQRAASYMEAA